MIFLKLIASLWRMVVAGFLAALMIGCASYVRPVPMAESKIPAAKVADAKLAVTRIFDLARATEAVADANAEICLLKAPRVGFLALINPALKDPELRAAYLLAGLTGDTKLFSVNKKTEAVDGKIIAQVADEKIGPGEAGKAWLTTLTNIREKKPFKVYFSDRTSMEFEYKDSCGGIVLTDINPADEPLNMGVGVELLPPNWLDAAKTDDERYFLSGRSLYYSSDAGQATLNRALIPGALLNATVRVFTLGLSRLVGEPMNSVVRMQRRSVLKEADAFGLQAAVRAGASPEKIMAFVNRLAAQKEKATAFQELWFEDGRADALAKVAAPLITKSNLSPTPVSLSSMIEPSADLMGVGTLEILQIPN